MLKTGQILFCIIVFISNLSLLNSQKLLLLEKSKEIEALKYGEGNTISFKTKQFPDEWLTKRIETILVDANTILVDDRMISIEDITHFRVQNPAANAFGLLFMGFGSSWFLFGTIAHFTTDNKFTWTNFAIGSTALAIGVLFRKIVSKRTFKIGKSARLRLVDISFPSPEIKRK